LEGRRFHRGDIPLIFWRKIRKRKKRIEKKKKGGENADRKGWVLVLSPLLHQKGRRKEKKKRLKKKKKGE